MLLSSLTTRLFLQVVLLMMLATSVVAIEPPKRYVGMMDDRTRISGEQLRDWYNMEKMPHLDGQPLFPEDKPLRWLIDSYLRPAPPAPAFVETVTGDLIPGSVIEFTDGSRSPFHQGPSHFIMKTDVRLTPLNMQQDTIRVDASYVRRVVWKRTSGIVAEPKTAVYRDGRRVSFRSARFDDGHVNLLLADGVRRVSYKELAEIALPQVEQWDKYLEMLASLLPDGEGRLMQIETDDGLLMTGAVDELRAFSQGNESESRNWRHGLQPAWSPEVIWVPNENVLARRCFSITEVPLTLLTPNDVDERSSLGHAGPRWQRNRNVRGGRLTSGGELFGWGIGVHATSRLSFDIPQAAVRFRSRVGLDDVVLDRGCAKVRVAVDDARTMYNGPLMIGSREVVDVGEVNLADRRGNETRFSLIVDAAHKDRPASADPLNIRDVVNWLDPTLILDPATVQQEIEARRFRTVYPWKRWELTDNDDSPLTSVRSWDELAPPPGRYDRAVNVVDEFTLQRTVQLTPRDRWLVVGAWSPRTIKEQPKLTITINKNVVREETIPLRDKGHTDPLPILIALSDYSRNEPTSIQGKVTPGSEELPVHFETLAITEQHPTLFEVFEDNAEFANVTAPATKTKDDKPQPPSNDPKRLVFSGDRCVRVDVSKPATITLPEPLKIRMRPRWGEYRFVQFAIRKAGGRATITYHDANGEQRSRIHSAGVGEPLTEGTREVRDKLPDEWIVITRDLAADFGEFNLTSFTLTTVDGTPAFFDRVYLGRSNPDFLPLR